MRKYIYPILILAAAAVYVVYQNEAAKAESDQNIAQEEFLNNNENQISFSRKDFLPKSKNQIVHHKSYSLSYNEGLEQADWTAHILSPKDINSKSYKRPYFETDPLVVTEAAHWNNYKNSGYDKGHLVPAADRKASLRDYKETFFTSNIAPQQHDFNAGIWNDLERKIRSYSINHGPLYVITGSILGNKSPEIGSQAIPVPEQFYKIIYRQQNDEQAMLAFLIPNRPTNQSIYDFIVPVDQIESLTGTDFFYQLPDDVEVLLESGSSAQDW